MEATHRPGMPGKQRQTGCRWRSFRASWSQVAQLRGAGVWAGRPWEADQAWPGHSEYKRFIYMDIVNNGVEGWWLF